MWRQPAQLLSGSLVIKNKGEKKIKKSIALFLCLVLLVSVCLCGCGSDNRKLRGSWVATVDIAEQINEKMYDSDPVIAAYMEISELNVTFNLNVNDDDYLSMVVDKDALEDELKEVMSEMTDDMMRYLEDMLNLSALGLSVDEALAMLGTDLDTLLEETYDYAIDEAALSHLNRFGYYYAKNGKLYISGAFVAAKSEFGKYDYYSLEKDVLTINQGTLEDEIPDFMYPLVFHKVG